jgi:hypothetical protein
MSIRLPDDSQRLLICGRTGGGKTMEALHHLSQRSFDEKPWIVIDCKGDDLVSSIPVSAPASIYDDPPGDPGLYVVKAEIEDHDKGGPLTDYLRKIYQQGNTGVLIDEGGMVGQRNRGLRTILTLGRSRKVPLIILTQRPVNVDKYAFSESEYLQIFYIQIKDDQDIVHGYISEEQLDFNTLRNKGLYYSAWFDVRANELTYMQPCPPFNEIYDRILRRLPVYVDPQPLAIPRRIKV